MIEFEEYLQNLLNVYNPETRFINEFRLRGKKGYAAFKVDSKFYCREEKMNHMTAVQMQLCINQFLFIFIAAVGKYDKLFAKYGFDINYINRFQIENTFITGQIFRFHKKINTSSSINAKMELVREKIIRDLNILDIEFDFNEKDVTGKVRVAIKTQ